MELYTKMFSLPEKAYSGSKLYADENLEHLQQMLNTSNLSRADRQRMKLKLKLLKKNVEKEFKPIKRKF